MSSKHQLTKTIFDNLADHVNPWRDKSIDSLVSDWWMTKRSPTCYRLSDSGKLAFELAEIQGYTFPFKVQDRDQYNLMFAKGILSKKIKCPYFIGLKNARLDSAYIIVYDSRVAMMITLYGDILDFLGIKNEDTN
jgi:hypothetical protein